MSADSGFKNEDIERARREESSKNKNVDKERLQLQRDTLQIIQSGTLEQLEEKLDLLGMGRNTEKGRELIQRFTSLRGGSRR